MILAKLKIETVGSKKREICFEELAAFGLFF
jgi:hypothetical protein